MSEWNESLDFAAIVAAILDKPELAQAIADGDDNAVAEAVNTVDVGLTISRLLVPTSEVLDAFDVDEYTTLDEKTVMQLDIILRNAPVLSLHQRRLVAALFPKGGPTARSIAALATRPCSLAESVVGHPITPADVGRALRNPTMTYVADKDNPEAGVVKDDVVVVDLVTHTKTVVGRMTLRCGSP